jgi:hypothetical protein
MRTIRDAATSVATRTTDGSRRRPRQPAGPSERVLTHWDSDRGKTAIYAAAIERDSRIPVTVTAPADLLRMDVP